MICKASIKSIVSVCAVLILWTLFVTRPAAAATYRFVSLEYPPYEYSENGLVKGIAVEIIKETFKIMGHEVKIEIWPWARSIDMLKNGEADGIFTFFKTKEREDFAIFSNEVIIMQKMSLWVRKDSNITYDGNLSHLQNYRIGVVRKTSYGDKFDAAVKNGSLKTIESYTIEDCINQLLKKRIDIWASNHLGALFELRKANKLSELKELIPLLQDIPSYVGFSKKLNREELRNDFDKALVKLKQSGRYDKIIKKYSY